jgi:hypothetical protein
VTRHLGQICTVRGSASGAKPAASRCTLLKVSALVLCCGQSSFCSEFDSLKSTEFRTFLANTGSEMCDLLHHTDMERSCEDLTHPSREFLQGKKTDFFL